jgi:hypothetical protein
VVANGGELTALKSHLDGTAEFYHFFPSLFFFFLFQRFALSLFSRTALRAAALATFTVNGEACTRTTANFFNA